MKVYNMDSGYVEPVTSFSWHPTDSEDHEDWQLIGSCQDGGIFDWMPSMGDKYERRFLT